MSDLYCVITIDIINSRKNEEALANLPSVVNRLNEQFYESLAADFKYYRGDEIQCVLLPNMPVLTIIRTIRYRLQPLEIRIGIGVGQISSDVEKGSKKLVNPNPWENNGEAFYLAREALRQFEDNKIYRKKPRTFYLNSMEFHSSHNRMLKSMLNLYDLSIDKWTTSQWDCVIAYEQHKKLEKAAKILDRKYQSVQRSISLANWYEIHKCEIEINELIYTKKAKD